jgi:hypothetical protein
MVRVVLGGVGAGRVLVGRGALATGREDTPRFGAGPKKPSTERRGGCACGRGV